MKRAAPAAVHIALLRAVNVGGRSVAMADLRAMLEAHGCANSRTLLQSGNAVFAVNAKSSAVALEKKLETEAQRRFGFAVAFMLRTAAEWEALVACNPFPDAAKKDPARLILMAFKGAPDADAIKALRDGYKGPETIHVAGREAYLIYPEGQGNSKLTNALIERKLGVAGTARNWNTVLKLAALAAA
jgi:uncharacterized protein (DUF1697 family)